MLLPGIKLGPKDWLPKIDRSQARFAEIWYRADKPEPYPEMLAELTNRGVGFGFHFWGITSTQHEANLAYPGPDQTESVELVHQCLEVAAAWQAAYVNLHSGNTRLMNLNLDNWYMTPDESRPVIEDDKSVNLRNRILAQLGSLANKLRLPLLVELVPLSTHNTSRLNPIFEYPTSPAGLLELCRQNIIGFTNDFCHTFAQKANLPRPELFQNFLDLTHQFLPYTQVCHINTLYRPYNGTDAHGGILAADFTQDGVFPTPTEYQQLYRLLNQTGRNIYLIGEPENHHLENYHELCRIVDSPYQKPEK